VKTPPGRLTRVPGADEAWAHPRGRDLNQAVIAVNKPATATTSDTIRCALGNGAHSTAATATNVNPNANTAAAGRMSCLRAGGAGGAGAGRSMKMINSLLLFKSFIINLSI